MVEPRPTDYHTVTPYLLVDGAARFVDFCVEAFGAERRGAMVMPDGTIGHAEVLVGDSVLMLADANDTMPASTVGLHLYVDDADAAYRRALAAGATSMEEPSDKFYGDRSGIATRSATGGRSPPTSRTCRRRRWSGAWPSSAAARVARRLGHRA